MSLLFSYYDRVVMGIELLEFPIKNLSFICWLAQRLYCNGHISFGIFWYERLLHSSSSRVFTVMTTDPLEYSDMRIFFIHQLPQSLYCNGNRSFGIFWYEFLFIHEPHSFCCNGHRSFERFWYESLLHSSTLTESELQWALNMSLWNILILLMDFQNYHHQEEKMREQKNNLPFWKFKGKLIFFYIFR